MTVGAERPCTLEGPGHAMRSITFWRRMPADARYDVERLEQVGPDTIRFLLGPQHGGWPRGLPPRMPGAGRQRIELTYCHHDVSAILEVVARVGRGTELWFDVSGVNLEWAGEDQIIQYISLCEPYRYQPCRDLSRDPQWPFDALTIPRIPEIDQLAAAGIKTKLTVGQPVDDGEVDEARFADLEDEEDERLTGEVVASLRIGASGWFDGASSKLLAVSPTEVGYEARWDPLDRGEDVIRDVEPGGLAITSLRWVVEEIDRLLDGFPAGRHLLRLVADGTVEDRCSLVHDDGDGEESFAVRFVVGAPDADVRAAATKLAACDPDAGGYAGSAEGIRADGEWRLVVPGRRKEPQRKRVSLPLERDDMR
jgi:hypothetical protein